MSYLSELIQLGTTNSSFKTVDNVPGTILAGKVVHSKSDGTYTVASADGVAIGVSIGGDPSGLAYTSVVRRGTGVPILLTAAFDPVVGTQVNISNTTGLAIASGGGATAVNALYATGREGGTSSNSGRQEDGTLAGVATIDFPGGL